MREPLFKSSYRPQPATSLKKRLWYIRASLPIGTNGKPLAATGKFSNTTGKLMIGKTLAANGEEIT